MAEVKVVQTTDAPAAIGPYSQGRFAGPFLFVSGQLPINPLSGQMDEAIADQTHRSLKNLKAIVESAGGTLESVVKTTVFLKDMNDFARVNEVYRQYFKENYPTRSAIEVAHLPKDAKVEIEAIAYIG
ncbi:RidA family protein [Desulfoscipio sp. XC116]|uniref:RidA family protein n=1 Tax=Desulfoscipio sp. XC116 TaxID=3144975 RepID=UPI00325B7890